MAASGGQACAENAQRMASPGGLDMASGQQQECMADETRSPPTREDPPWDSWPPLLLATLGDTPAPRASCFDTKGMYVYTAHLVALEGHVSPSPSPVPPCLRTVQTPLCANHWAKSLSGHPDRQLVAVIMRGITQGFRIGYRRGGPLRSTLRNMSSVMATPYPVQQFLDSECAAGRMVGPLPRQGFLNIHVSRLGVIPKSHQPGRWRVILDLSHPDGASVNDGIDTALCSLAYTTVDEAAARILQLGRQTLLAKVDVEAAYRNVPVHPEDRWLLGMLWKEAIYVDTVLPFGLRSAPKLFTALADALEWVLQQEGVSCLQHYLDDFFTMAPAGQQQCAANLAIIRRVCVQLGLPLKEEKIEGPSTSLVFLGIEIDTDRMELRLPTEKLSRLRGQLAAWSNARRRSKRALLSLIGQLAHACKVVPAGRIFLRRMIDTAMKARKLEHWVFLSAEFRSDLAWWQRFITVWNGRSLMDLHAFTWNPAISFSTDASGSWGCGALWGSNWFHCPWEGHWRECSIACKEMLPIVMAAALWGHQWHNCQVQVWSDNMAAVQVVNKLTSPDPILMHLLRCLHFFAAHYAFKLRAAHVAG